MCSTILFIKDKIVKFRKIINYTIIKFHTKNKK